MAKTSWASSEGVRRSTTANRGRDTGPELAVRRVLHAKGVRYRVDFAPLGGRRRADIVLTRQRVAVVKDGCFWHGCPDHYSAPVRNREFWADKVDPTWRETLRQRRPSARRVGWCLGSRNTRVRRTYASELSRTWSIVRQPGDSRDAAAACH